MLAAVALGSNLGDRVQHLNFAHHRLAALLAGLRLSPVIETDPVDVPDAQGRFLNQAATGWTRLAARDLLHALQAIERDAGRERPHWHAARTLDLDLVIYDAAVQQEGGLMLPHPRFRERAFVLGPLAAIAPDLRDPVTGFTMAMLYSLLPPASPAARR